MKVVVEGIYDNFPDAGPPAMTVMKVSGPLWFQARMLMT